MTKKFKIFLECLTLLFFTETCTLQGQILQDTVSLNLVKKGIDYIYNFQFIDAGEVFTKINQSYPGHPIGYLFRGMKTYWENYPLLPSSPACVSYEADMHRCIKLCDKMHNPSDEAEYLLADLCARGMLLMFYADNDLSLQVIPLATSTYPYIRRSFDYTASYNDFSFFTGLYNYYREAYPETYPVYKTLAFLFPKGDMKTGLKELQTASKYSIVLKAEASSFLSGICLSFENDYQQASFYSKSLHELYPANIQYLSVYIKNLLLIKQYDEAESLILSTNTYITNSYYLAQISIFNGILLEKKYHNYILAKEYYNKGIMEILPFGFFGNEYAAYAYFGLSRICQVDGDKKNKKLFRKKALELADFKKVNFDE